MQMSGLLLSTGEFTVETIKKLLDYNEKNKVVEKAVDYVKKQINSA